MTSVVYYTSVRGENPVSNFLDGLTQQQQTKVLRIVFNIEKYGLSSILPHIKKLSSTPLWEIRILGKDNIRVLYAAIQNDTILLIHGFVKKTQKTPNKEIFIALKRLNDYRTIQD